LLANGGTNSSAPRTTGTGTGTGHSVEVEIAETANTEYEATVH